MGRSHAVALAREGCDLLLCDILEGLPDGTPYPKATRADMDETVRLVEEQGRRCIAVDTGSVCHVDGMGQRVRAQSATFDGG